MRKQQKVYGWLSAICWSLAIVCLVALLNGCAPMTEQYWHEYYANMTQEEIEAAKASDVTVTDIWLDAQTSSRLVCIDGDCMVVQIY